MNKTKKHSYYLGIIALAVIVALAVVVAVFTRQTGGESAQTTETLYTKTVELGTIETTVPGTGTLENQTAIDLELPAEVKVLEWYVVNGDEVQEGDLLAQVDKVSVMSGIVAVQDMLSEVDSALKEHEDDEISDAISTGADGRVKKIYAEKGKNVLDTMYEEGALMLLSLDGLMAVALDSDQDLPPETSVEVTLEDGMVVDGKVESALNKTIVVTFSDKVADCDEMVSVNTKDGNDLGTGKAYIHSELKITGFSGTVSSVKVSENEAVSSGKTLMVLSDTDYEGEYETLLAQRKVLEDQMNRLFQLYQDQYIYAGCKGVISGLDESADTTVGTTGVSYHETNTLRNTLQLTAQLTDEIEDGSSQDTDESENGSSQDIEETDKQIGYDTYIGVVKSLEADSAKMSLLSVSGEGQLGTEYTLMFAGASGMLPVYVFSNETYEAGSAADIQQDDVLLLVMQKGASEPTLCIRISDEDEMSEEEQDDGTGNIPQQALPDRENQQGDSNQAGSSQFPQVDIDTSLIQSQVEIEEVEAIYSVETITWLSVIPQETMNITITIDEMDILSVENGQSAVVTLDAFPGQSFEGTVVSINRAGTNEGGSSKYSATVQIARETDMLSGMNASVNIKLDSFEDRLLISENALVETEEGVFVYTEYDEKKDELGGLVQVTTGLSDGENVEILSGLEEGSPYCYKIYDVVNYVTFTSQGGVSMNSFFGAGRR